MNPNVLTISLFGGLTLRLGKTAVSGFASRKVEALLAYLAYQSRPIPREQLATLLWPTNSTARALGNLSVALNSLRQQLDPYILADRHTIGLNPAAPIQIDVAKFEAAFAQATRQQHQVGRLSRTVAALLKTAVSHYQGPFLAGFHIRQTADFEAWVLLENERLQQQYQTVLANLIAFHQQRDQLATSIIYANQLLALDPLHEEAQRQLMRLYAQNNQRSAAIAQYEQCRRLLGEELGVEPDEQTQALYQQLLAGTLPTQPRPLVPLPSRHNLLAATTSFVGREAELAQIDAWLADPNGRLLTLFGTGGLGKTRLAQEAARTHIGQFAGGVWQASLAAQTDFNGLLTAVADAVGYSFSQQPDPAAALARHLRNQELLLLLDNFEHLLNDQSRAWLSQLTEQAPELKLLVTSRQRLDLPAEQILPLQGLPFPQNGSLDARKAATTFPAVSLFVERVQQVAYGFQVAGQETAVIQLCQLVAGLPLALELAATWTRLLDVSGIVIEIERNLHSLKTTFRDLPARHRSLQAVFDFSWQLLDAAEQTAFAQLAVFRNGFTETAAHAVTGCTPALLASLVDKSLLWREEQPHLPIRYRRHPLLRQFALAKFEGLSEEKTAVWAAYAQHYGTFLADQEAYLLGSTPEKAVKRIRPEVENIKRAWQWAAQWQNGRLLNQMGDSIMQAFDLLDLYQDVVTMAEQAIQHLAVANLAEPETAVAYGRSLGLAGAFHFRLGNYEQAAQQCAQALTVLAPHQPHIAYAHTFIYAGAAAYGLGDFEQVRRDWQAAQASYEAVGSLWGQSTAAQNLAQIEWLLGKTEVATAAAQRGLKLAEQLNNQQLMGGPLQILSGLALAAGELAQAHHYAERAVACHRQTEHQAHLANALTTLGNVAQQQGHLDEAYQLFSESVQLARASHNHLYLVTHLIHLGEIEQQRGLAAQAQTIFEEALHEALATQSWELAVRAVAHLSKLFAEQGGYEQATLWAACVLVQETAVSDVQALATEVLQKCATQLPAELYAAAVAQGEKTAVLDLAPLTLLAG